MNTDIDSLKAENERLKKSNDELWAFLRHFNHALRTPLTTISGVAEILELSKGLDDGQKQLVGALASSARSLKEIVATIPAPPKTGGK